MNLYETERLLNEYLLFHYGRDEEVLPWEFGPTSALGFARRSVTELLDREGLSSQGRALDLGCAVGRSSYELAQVFREVIGVDYSQRFIKAAETIRREGSVSYARHDEARASTQLVARRPHEVESSRIRFETGDAEDLRKDLGAFDVVHAANLLCRLSQPRTLLRRLPALVKPGGQLLLTTPCSWMEDFTPSAHWPKGSTLEWLEDKLAPHFSRVHRVELPFLIREHARKYQWIVALGTRWVRN